VASSMRIVVDLGIIEWNGIEWNGRGWKGGTLVE